MDKYMCDTRTQLPPASCLHSTHLKLREWLASGVITCSYCNKETQPCSWKQGMFPLLVLSVTHPESQCCRAMLPLQPQVGSFPCFLQPAGALGVPWLVAPSLQCLPPTSHVCGPLYLSPHCSPFQKILEILWSKCKSSYWNWQEKESLWKLYSVLNTD